MSVNYRLVTQHFASHLAKLSRSNSQHGGGRTIYNETKGNFPQICLKASYLTASDHVTCTPGIRRGADIVLHLHLRGVDYVCFLVSSILKLKPRRLVSSRPSFFFSVSKTQCGLFSMKCPPSLELLLLTFCVITVVNNLSLLADSVVRLAASIN